jgi:lysophospholipase L1-like esterase
MRSWLRPQVVGVVLALVVLTGCQTTPRNTLSTHNPSKWEKEIARLEASSLTNPPPSHGIVFVGSSSIRLWTSLTSDFPNLPVINRGFGGSMLADSWFYADRIVIPLQPRQVVIYAGGNDINAGKNPDEVFGDFVALARKLRAALPKTRLAFISSAPNPARWAQVEKVKRLNQQVENYCRRHNMDFINVFPLMLGPDGSPKPDIYVPDRLHMNENGYAIWRGAVGPYLK